MRRMMVAPLNKQTIVRLAWQIVIMFVAMMALLVTCGVIALFIQDATPIFKESSFYSTRLNSQYIGMVSSLVSTLASTSVTLLICGPLGIGCALYIHEIASPTVASVLRRFFGLISYLPSVVFGLFGLSIIAPSFNWSLSARLGIAVLCMMTLPTIIVVSDAALSILPTASNAASTALGASRAQTIFYVTLRSARRGLSAAVLCGAMRAMGDSVALMLVSGNLMVLNGSVERFFRGGMSTLSTTILRETKSLPSGGPLYGALFGMALLLVSLIWAMRLLVDWMFKGWWDVNE